MSSKKNESNHERYETQLVLYRLQKMIQSFEKKGLINLTENQKNDIKSADEIFKKYNDGVSTCLR